jgi:hypothetical protein
MLDKIGLILHEACLMLYQVRPILGGIPFSSSVTVTPMKGHALQIRQFLIHLPEKAGCFQLCGLIRLRAFGIRAVCRDGIPVNLNL